MSDTKLVGSMLKNRARIVQSIGKSVGNIADRLEAGESSTEMIEILDRDIQQLQSMVERIESLRNKLVV